MHFAKFENATPTTGFIPSEPNFMINEVIIKEYKVFNIFGDLACCTLTFYH